MEINSSRALLQHGKTQHVCFIVGSNTVVTSHRGSPPLHMLNKNISRSSSCLEGLLCLVLFLQAYCFSLHFGCSGLFCDRIYADRSFPKPLALYVSRKMSCPEAPCYWGLALQVHTLSIGNPPRVSACPQRVLVEGRTVWLLFPPRVGFIPLQSSLCLCDPSVGCTAPGWNQSKHPPLCRVFPVSAFVWFEWDIKHCRKTSTASTTCVVRSECVTLAEVIMLEPALWKTCSSGRCTVLSSAMCLERLFFPSP